MTDATLGFSTLGPVAVSVSVSVRALWSKR